jgi:hypothetical protein
MKQPLNPSTFALQPLAPRTEMQGQAPPAAKTSVFERDCRRCFDPLYSSLLRVRNTSASPLHHLLVVITHTHPQLADFLGAVPADAVERLPAEVLQGLARLPGQLLSEMPVLMAELTALLSSAAPGGESMLPSHDPHPSRPPQHTHSGTPCSFPGRTHVPLAHPTPGPSSPPRSDDGAIRVCALELLIRPAPEANSRG